MTALAPYPSPEAREAEFEASAAAVGAEVVPIGESVEGRPIRAVRVGAGQDERVLVCANIHGVEFISAKVALGFLEAMAEPAEPLKTLMARAEIWVVPCLNPDGYARTWSAGGSGALHVLRKNANGVDLNRNFEMPAAPPRVLIDLGGWRTGSDTPENPFYRGTAAFSEPESRAVRDLMNGRRFRAGVNLHSFMGSLIPPCVTRADDYTTYAALCRAYQSGQDRRYFRLANRSLDIFTGEQEDYQHHVHGTWAICVEVFPVAASFRQHVFAPNTFWRFNPADPAPWIENEIGGLCAFFAAALDTPPPQT